MSMELSARNQLTGTIKDIKQDDVMAEVTVTLAGGQDIISVITAASAQKLGLAVGKQVTVIVKSTEVMLGVE
jgi:molybdate transport system regulatory protein